MKISSIEGLRGIAILLVVIFHLDRSVLPSGFIGVDIFITISGFVIFRSIHRRLTQKEGFQFWTFSYRRARRLIPTLVIALILFSPLLNYLQSPLGGFQNSMLTGVSSLIGASNGVIQFLSGGYFGDDAEFNAFLHTWSLSVELQFYLVFGVLMVFVFEGLRARFSTLSSLRVIAYLLFVPSLLIMLITQMFEFPFAELGLYGYYSPIPRAWQFALGGLIALSSKSPTSSILFHLIQIGSLFTVLVVPILGLDSITFLGSFFSSTIASVAAAVLLLRAEDGGLANRLLGSVSLVYLGRISYSLYVFHWPLLVISRTLSMPIWADMIAIAAAIGLAAINYYGLERPLMASNGNPRLGRHLSSYIVLTLLSTSGLVFVYQGFALHNPKLEDLRSQVEERHLPAKHDWLCATGPLTNNNFTRCRIGENQKGIAPVYLLGDSQAGMHAEAILRIAKEIKSELIMTTTTGCPFFVTSQSSERCRDFVEGSLDFMNSANPGRIFLTFAPFEDEAPSKTEAFLRNLGELQRVGHEIYLIEAVPHFEEFKPLRCSRLEVESFECFPSVGERELRGQLNAIDRLFSTAEENGLARILEVRSLVCIDEKCRTILDGRVLYRDSSHLSVSFNDVSWRHLIRQLSY